MPNDKGLHAPTPVVAERKPVHVTPETLEGDVPAVDAVLLLAVQRVISHLWIEPDNYITHRLEKNNILLFNIFRCGHFPVNGIIYHIKEWLHSFFVL